MRGCVDACGDIKKDGRQWMGEEWIEREGETGKGRERKRERKRGMTYKQDTQFHTKFTR